MRPILLRKMNSDVRRFNKVGTEMIETNPKPDKPDDPPYPGGEDETPREDPPPEQGTGEGLPLRVV